MSEATQTICPHCNAKQLGPAETCWLCSKSLSATPQGLPPITSLPEQEPQRFNFSLATLFLLITLASVCMGLLVALPGLGIMACIILVPVFFRTMRVVRYREARGQPVNSTEKITLFLGSFMVSSVLVIVVCVAAFCSFCGVCLTIVSLGGETEFLPITLGVCALGIGAIFVAIRMNKWNRRRFRRDVGEA